MKQFNEFSKMIAYFFGIFFTLAGFIGLLIKEVDDVNAKILIITGLLLFKEDRKFSE